MSGAAHVQIGDHWVDVLYRASNLGHSTRWEDDEVCGDYKAQVTLGCASNLQDTWTEVGQLVTVHGPNGGPVWGGVTVEPERGPDGVTIHAVGIGETLAQFDAIYDADPTGSTDWQPTFVPNDAVDAAVARGARFTRAGVDLGSTALPNEAGQGALTVLELLMLAATQQGKRVHVDTYGRITFRSDPTTPEFTLTPDELYMGNADDQYRSRLWGYFLKQDAAIYKVKLTGSPTGGTFTLSGNGATTAAIARTANAATVQVAVRTLGGVFANAVVTSPASMQWVINLTSGSAVLTGLGTGTLTGGTNPGVSINQTRGDGYVMADDEDAEAAFGVNEGTLDLSNLGPITQAEAQTFTDGRFALVGGRMGWTEQVEAGELNLMHIDGAWAAPWALQAGTMLQIPGNMDARSTPTVRGSIRFVMSLVEVSYAVSPSSTVTPIGFAARDFEGALAAPPKPEEDVA